MVDLIEFINISKLDEDSQRTAKEIVSKYAPKIKKILEDATSATIHINEIKKSDHPSHFIIRLKILIPKKVLEVEKDDHDLTTALHKTFEALKNEFSHYINKQ